MKIESEWILLEKIRERIIEKGIETPHNLVVPVGDDCAVFDIDDKWYGLFTTDISIESVHFRKDLSSPEDIGFKSMMSNISDITAMGGLPKYALISIGVPAGCEEEFVLSIYDGLLEAAGPAGLAVAGGDISRSNELIINIALYGEVKKDQLIKRDGARNGDIIYMTGHTGDSKAGLEILQSAGKNTIREFKPLCEKHKRPIARFEIINDVINVFKPASMIDISDGLLSDLRHICEKSSCGFVLFQEKLPISSELMAYSEKMNKSPYHYVLTGGEDHELLFTSEKSLAEMMEMSINNIPITPIGEIIEKGFNIFKENKTVEISIAGFDHFLE